MYPQTKNPLLRLWWRLFIRPAVIRARDRPLHVGQHDPIAEIRSLDMTEQAIVDLVGAVERITAWVDSGGGPFSRLIPAASRDLRVILTALETQAAENAGARHHLDACGQIAGKALGYPWFKDDQKNFPGTTEENGVCIGEHVDETIVEELANAYAKLAAENVRLVELYQANFNEAKRAQLAAEQRLAEIEAGVTREKVSKVARDFIRAQGFSGGWDHDGLATEILALISRPAPTEAQP